jgi:hypothetical protein
MPGSFTDAAALALMDYALLLILMETHKLTGFKSGALVSVKRCC